MVEGYIILLDANPFQHFGHSNLVDMCCNIGQDAQTEYWTALCSVSLFYEIIELVCAISM